MTNVYFNIEEHHDSYSRVFATFTPTVEHHHAEGALGSRRPYSLDITGGRTVDLEATDKWLWRIQIQGMNLDLDGYYAIPDTNDTLNYRELLKVDPSTMPSEGEPEPAWWVALELALAQAGSRWFDGAGPPTQNGKTGDYYLDRITGTYYRYTEGS